MGSNECPRGESNPSLCFMGARPESGSLSHCEGGACTKPGGGSREAPTDTTDFIGEGVFIVDSLEG